MYIDRSYSCFPRLAHQTGKNTRPGDTGRTGLMGRLHRGACSGVIVPGAKVTFGFGGDPSRDRFLLPNPTFGGAFSSGDCLPLSPSSFSMDDTFDDA
jgi:hypothetical protein